MKKTLMVMGLIIVFSVANAQYSLQPMLPIKGMIQKSSLWNVLIINNSQNSIVGRLELILRHRNTGIEEITATTNQITIEKGVKQLNYSLLSPIQYNFLNNGFIIVNQDLIPIGNYTACYRFSNPLTKNITIVEECIQFDVEPLSPPMLATPSDNTEFDIQPTQFSWSPPTPIGLFRNLKYDIVIVEVLAEQKPEEALQQNIPIYSEYNSTNNFINYKGSKLIFQKDKIYAWQVVAKDNNDYAAKSEVWSFKLNSPKFDYNNKNNQYLLINYQNTNNTISITNNVLPIKYNGIAIEDNLTITLINQKGVQLEETNQKTIYGDNYIYLKLKSKLNANNVYTLKVTDQKGKINISNFTFNKNN
jgi:hypothetical protein